MENFLGLEEHDQSQRELALDASKSFIVQAPAGSGKTELLIQRFLTLLNYVKAPEEILAITFTKKAASEMRLRVINALKYALSEPEPHSNHAKKTYFLAKKVLERDQQYHWNLIDNPNQLGIQTIDSLCAYLTRQLPMLSQFGSQPDIAQNPNTLYREAVQEVLTHVEENYEWSQSIALLLLHLDNDLNKLHDLLVSLLAKRDQWLPYIQFNQNNIEIKTQLERHLANVVTDTLETLRGIFPHELSSELMAIARFAADNLTISKNGSPLIACRNQIDLPDTKPADKTAWLGIATLLLTKKFSWRKRLDKEIGFPALPQLKNPQEKLLHTEFRQRLMLLIEKLNTHEDLRIALTGLFFLPEAYYQKTQWDILQALLNILKIVAAQLRVTFEQHGQIDFIENAQAALVALGNDENPTDLALALDYQIRHILVDEFQDTSSTQYQLIEKLILGWEKNDGRSLFIVGDPMQSIYRFREAEVGLFIRMVKNGIGNINLIPLTLSLNFRSAAKIVNWNNSHFQQIFPTFDDVATGAVKYSRSQASQTEEASNANTSIEIKGFITPDERTEANHIVTLCKTMQAQFPHEKTAILVRSRTHLKTIIPALKQANIAYSALDIDPLATRQCIQDVLSLTNALLHPADRIAWLSILRAPWCGLTLADLFIIANENPYATIWDQLTRQEIIGKLSDDGRNRVARIIPILKTKISDRERGSLRSFIEQTWQLIGGPACLNSDDELDDVQAFFNLLQEFSESNHLFNAEGLKERINQLYATTEQDDNTLHIMTIHTAKGLEFDTVILPHLERKMPKDDKPLLAWMERPLSNDQIALLLAPIHATGDDQDAIFEYISRQQKIKTDYETDRLFYVATTRAKKRLFLFYDTEQKDNGDFKIESGSFLEKLWPFLEKQQQFVIADPPHTEYLNLADNTQRMITRLTPAWQNPIKDQANNVFFHQQQDGFQLPDMKFILVGIITHKILQQISQFGFSWWQDKNAKQQNDYLRHHLSQRGILPNQLESAIGMINSAIQKTLTDDRGRWILSPQKEAQSEFAINALINGKIESLVIDRTFIDDSGIRWIIDYKTTTFTHKDLEFFLAKEQEKYFEKMQTYAEALQMLDAREIRLGLYFPALPAWKEWM